MKKFISRSVVSLAAVALFAAAAYGQTKSAGADDSVLANKIAALQRDAARLLVTSSSFTSGGTLDAKFTQDGDNISPSLSWTGGPLGTQSYVVLTEGVNVVNGHPIIHWMIYNIPSRTTALPQNVPSGARLENGDLNGAMQGKVRGSAGYAGPKLPAGRTREYHFEVFALNTNLNLDPATADRQVVVNAMKDHVLTSGEIVVNSTGK